MGRGRDPPTENGCVGGGATVVVAAPALASPTRRRRRAPPPLSDVSTLPARPGDRTTTLPRLRPSSRDGRPSPSPSSEEVPLATKMGWAAGEARRRFAVGGAAADMSLRVNPLAALEPECQWTALGRGQRCVGQLCARELSRRLGASSLSEREREKKARCSASEKSRNGRPGPPLQKNAPPSPTHAFPPSFSFSASSLNRPMSVRRMRSTRGVTADAKGARPSGTSYEMVSLTPVSAAPFL